MRLWKKLTHQEIDKKKRCISPKRIFIKNRGKYFWGQTVQFGCVFTIFKGADSENLKVNELFYGIFLIYDNFIKSQVKASLNFIDEILYQN